MRKLTVLLIMSWSFCVHAFTLSLPASEWWTPNHQAATYSVFLSANTQTTEQLDSWHIDGGYSYPILQSVDLYIGARLTSLPAFNYSPNHVLTKTENGLLTGVRYALSPTLSLSSSIHSFRVNDEEDAQLSAEISSRMHIQDNLELHATFDIQELQQGLEVGLGFRF